MGIKEDIDVVAADSAAFIFSSVDHSIDQKFAAIRDHTWIYSNRMIGRGNGTGRGVAPPAFGAGTTWTVSSGFKRTQIGGLSIGCEAGNGGRRLTVSP